jgi:hypothetical protein
MTDNGIKRCICGRPAIVLVNEITWTCGDCAMRKAIKGLGCGIGIVRADKDVAKMLLWPREAENEQNH